MWHVYGAEGCGCGVDVVGEDMGAVSEPCVRWVNDSEMRGLFWKTA